MTETISDDLFVRRFQLRAKQHGIYSGAIGGNAGPLTQAALDKILPPLAPVVEKREPWIEVGLETLGWHEDRDNARLRAWLKRDGKTLGDPDSLPWCGDWVETCIKIALPGEALAGPLGENPYWAQNWQHLGMRVEPSLHAVGVFTRPGGGGHVGFLVGQDSTHFHVLGGNQSDSVNVTRIEKGRLIAARWPKSYDGQPKPLPTRSAGDLSISTNEA